MKPQVELQGDDAGMVHKATRTVGDVLLATGEFVRNEVAKATDPQLDPTTQGVAKIRAAAQQDLLDYMVKLAQGVS